MRLLLSVFLILSFLPIQAQFTTQYQWKDAPPLVYECDRLGNISRNEQGAIKVAPNPNSKFIILNPKNADTLIAEFNISKDTEFIKQYNINTTFRNRAGAEFNAKNVLGNKLYFLISKSQLGNSARGMYQKGLKSGKLTVGAGTLPLKLRLYNFNFAEKVNIGSTVGFRIRTSKTKSNFINYLANFGLSVNNMDAESIRNPFAVAVENIAAFSFGGGIVFQTGQAQIGIFTGIDFLSHSNWMKYRWVHNKRPWIGIGIGVNIFTDNTGDQTATNEKND